MLAVGGPTPGATNWGAAGSGVLLVLMLGFATRGGGRNEAAHVATCQGGHTGLGLVWVLGLNVGLHGVLAKGVLRVLVLAEIIDHRVDDDHDDERDDIQSNQYAYFEPFSFHFMSGVCEI